MPILTAGTTSEPRTIDRSKIGAGLLTAVAAFAATLWIARAIDDTSTKLGIVDRRMLLVQTIVATLTSLATGAGIFTGLESVLPKSRRAVAVVAALFAAGLAAWVWVVYANRPDSEIEIRTMNAAEPYRERVLVSGGNGYRYLITLETSGTLRATLRLRGDGFEMEAPTPADGQAIQRLEGVLPGEATWTALISHVSGEGKYRLFVDAAPPKVLGVPMDEDLRQVPSGITYAAYRLSITSAEDLYIRVRAADGGLAPDAALMDSSGQDLVAGVKNDDTTTIFLRAKPGAYTLRVQPVGTTKYLLAVLHSDPASPSQTPPTTLATGEVTVPNVYRLPVDDAVAALTAAGLKVRSYLVCSNSMSGAQNAGLVRQVVLAGATSTSDEREVVGPSGVSTAYTTLPVGTSVEVKVANGSSCSG